MKCQCLCQQPIYYCTDAVSSLDCTASDDRMVND